MLKKEKKRAQDAAAQLANITNSQSQSTSSVSTVELSQEGSMETISADHRGRAIQYMKRGTSTSRCSPFLKRQYWKIWHVTCYICKIVFERLLICCDIESKCESGPASFRCFFLNIAISGLKMRPYNLVQPTQKEFIEPNYQKKKKRTGSTTSGI